MREINSAALPAALGLQGGSAGIARALADSPSDKSMGIGANAVSPAKAAIPYQQLTSASQSTSVSVSASETESASSNSYNGTTSSNPNNMGIRNASPDIMGSVHQHLSKWLESRPSRDTLQERNIIRDEKSISPLFHHREVIEQNLRSKLLEQTGIKHSGSQPSSPPVRRSQHYYHHPVQQQYQQPEQQQQHYQQKQQQRTTEFDIGPSSLPSHSRPHEIPGNKLQNNSVAPEISQREIESKELQHKLEQLEKKQSQQSTEHDTHSRQQQQQQQQPHNSVNFNSVVNHILQRQLSGSPTSSQSTINSNGSSHDRSSSILLTQQSAKEVIADLIGSISNQLVRKSQTNSQENIATASASSCETCSAPGSIHAYRTSLENVNGASQQPHSSSSNNNSSIYSGVGAGNNIGPASLPLQRKGSDQSIRENLVARRGSLQNIRDSAALIMDKDGDSNLRELAISLTRDGVDGSKVGELMASMLMIARSNDASGGFKEAAALLVKRDHDQKTNNRKNDTDSSTKWSRQRKSQFIQAIQNESRFVCFNCCGEDYEGSEFTSSRYTYTSFFNEEDWKALSLKPPAHHPEAKKQNLCNECYGCCSCGMEIQGITCDNCGSLKPLRMQVRGAPEYPRPRYLEDVQERRAKQLKKTPSWGKRLEVTLWRDPAVSDSTLDLVTSPRPIEEVSKLIAEKDAAARAAAEKSVDSRSRKLQFSDEVEIEEFERYRFYNPFTKECIFNLDGGDLFNEDTGTHFSAARIHSEMIVFLDPDAADYIEYDDGDASRDRFVLFHDAYYGNLEVPRNPAGIFLMDEAEGLMFFPHPDTGQYIAWDSQTGEISEIN